MLRVSEVYPSVQGEGPRVGSPTIFVRFAGCNLRCPGWPCDTPHAIDPRKYRNEWRLLDTYSVTELVCAEGPSGANICFTGGEPFLQPSNDLEELIERLSDRGFTIFEIFTNGTRPFPYWTSELAYIIMDWKLPGSGEEAEDLLAERHSNVMGLGPEDVIKFTVKDHKDLSRASWTWSELQARFRQADRIEAEWPKVFCGPVWGKMDAADVADWILEHEPSWRLNLQTHNIIWDRNQRGI